jgi:acyl-CoA synthetase (AMP-forming)/AMP-acid ligase II
MLLGDLAHRGAVLWPSRAAFVWAGHRRTYAELADRVARLSAVFAAAGVRPGGRIALLAVNAPEAVETLFAASLLGACVVPLNVRLAPAEIRFQVEDAAAEHAVVHPGLESLARASGLLGLAHWTLGEELDSRLDRDGAADAPRPGGEGPVMQLYTSGTTGRPKGCLLTDGGWVTATANAAHAFGVTGEDRLLATLPFFHVAGFGAALAHLAAGGTVVIPSGAGLEESWSLIAEHDVTVATFPAGTGRALRHPAARPVRLVYGMAGVHRPATLRALADAGGDYRGVYGSTEAGNFVTVSTLAGELARPGTIGRPLPAFDLEVAAPPGEVGELLLSGPSMMAGYANLPEATAEALRGGMLHTGDLVRADADGYLYFAGRVKDMIKTGGENVYPAEVEKVLLAHPRVADVAVVGVPDRRWGEAVKAFVVAREPVGTEELDAHCRERLGGFKRPRSYAFVTVIPRNHSGKVVRRELRG